MGSRHVKLPPVVALRLATGSGSPELHPIIFCSQFSGTSLLMSLKEKKDFFRSLKPGTSHSHFIEIFVYHFIFLYFFYFKRSLVSV